MTTSVLMTGSVTAATQSMIMRMRFASKVFPNSSAWLIESIIWVALV